MTPDELSDFADALRRRRSADEELSRLLGHPVERWNLCELVAARALDLELARSDPKQGHLGTFRTGPLAGSRVNLRFYRVREPLRPPAPGWDCDYHVVLQGSPDAEEPETLQGVYLFDASSFLRELQRGGGRKKEAWKEAEVFPCRSSRWEVLGEGASGLLYQVSGPRLRTDPSRRRTDPENRFPGWSLLPFEELAERIIENLGPPLGPLPRITRTRDAIQLEWRGSEGVVILLTPEILQVRLPTVHWPHPHEPRASSGLESTMTLAKARSTEGFLEALERIHAGVHKRRAQFRTCRFCGERFPPEYGHDRTTCDGCAQEHLGVIH